MGEIVPGEPGVTLERNAIGSLAVCRDGTRLGWIHHQIDGKWRAYLPGDGFTGRPLGGPNTKFDAVRAIVQYADFGGLFDK